MRLVAYKQKNTLGPYRMGVVHHENVLDLQEAYRLYLLKRDQVDLANAIEHVLPSDLTSFFKLGEQSIQHAQVALNFSEEHDVSAISFLFHNVTLAPPVPNGAKVICIGTNYKNHVAEMKANIPEYPVLFSKFSNALIGANDDIQKSPYTEKLDYEGEFTVVIGKEASHVKKENALDYIAGYTIGNDISARDLQKRTPQWLQGKSLDKSTPIGPWIVTAEELTDPSNVQIETYVNGEKRQSSNTKHLIFNIPTLIEFISSLITLQPGDVILTGTPDGVGFAMDPPQFLKAGDTIRIEVAGVGVLENKVVDMETPDQ